MQILFLKFDVRKKGFFFQRPFFESLYVNCLYFNSVRKKSREMCKNAPGCPIVSITTFPAIGFCHLLLEEISSSENHLTRFIVKVFILRCSHKIPKSGVFGNKILKNVKKTFLFIFYFRMMILQYVS